MNDSNARPAPVCTIVIFGAAGDLTLRLLMPSIYNLTAAGMLDKDTRFLGADHNDHDAGSWRTEVGNALHEFASAKGAVFQATIDEATWNALAERFDYQRMDFTRDDDYDVLAKKLADQTNVLFYFAVSPRFFETIAQGIARAGLLKERPGAFRRMVIEKPFGHDLDSARHLNAILTSLADEAQIYRIDHFLGKEAVQGIPVLRFASNMLEPLLNRDVIASVQITAAETVGVEERGGFYEGTGALRDMVPNHLFSLLTLIAMDEPRTYDAAAVLDAKAALLAAIQPLGPADAVRGQYAAGSLDGAAVKAYTEEDNVAADSRTETYAALCVRINNDRWRNVPFYIRTGKRMTAHVTTIALEVRPRQGLFGPDPTMPHLVLFGVDPKRGLVQRFAAKRPGVDLELGRATASFFYDQAFREPPNVGYETLLYHALCGSALLFQRADMIEHEWSALQDVLRAWAQSDKPEIYAAGTDGPVGADKLLARNGDRWLPVAPLETFGQ